MTMKNLLLSMVDMNDYLTNVLDYTEKILTPKMEKTLIQILKKYNVPHNNLKYTLKILNENPYYGDIKLDSVHSD
jgi:hypothetical protein